MKKNKIIAGLVLGLSSVFFVLPVFAGDAGKSVVKGILLSGNVEIENLNTNVFVGLDILVFQREQVRTLDDYYGYLAPVLPPPLPFRPEFPSMPVNPQTFDIPSSNGPLGTIQVEISSINYMTGSSETVWDSFVDDSALMRNPDGSTSLHLNSCEMIAGVTENCTIVHINWMPDGVIDLAHKARMKESGMNPFDQTVVTLVHTSKNSIKSTNITATVNLSGAIDSETGTGMGSIYRVRYTSKPVLN